jgi:hypothetical protein
MAKQKAEDVNKSPNGAQGRKTRGRARPKRHLPGSMNQFELDYSLLLEEAIRQPLFIGPKSQGAPPAPLESYCFESFRLRLAIKTWWLPDFMVVTSDGLIEFHEVKGIWQDAARIKIKTAAELYPQFLFIAITKEPKKRGGGWTREVFRSSMQVD